MTIAAESTEHDAGGAVGGPDHGAADAWFAEARRLFDEAEERLAQGSPLSALSSLIAVPPLHRMIVDRCSKLLEGPSDVSDDGEPPCGLYL